MLFGHVHDSAKLFSSSVHDCSSTSMIPWLGSSLSLALWNLQATKLDDADSCRPTIILFFTRVFIPFFSVLWKLPKAQERGPTIKRSQAVGQHAWLL